MGTLESAKVPITIISYKSELGGYLNITSAAGEGPQVIYGNGIVGAHEQDVVRAIAATGRSSAAVRASGKRNPTPPLKRPTRLIHVETRGQLSVPTYSVAEAAAMLTAVEHSGEPADAILQSQSAIAGIIAAYKQPDELIPHNAFKDIVLAYPAGLIKHRLRLIEAIRRAVQDRRAWLHHSPSREENIHTKHSLVERARAIAYGLRPVARLRSALALGQALLGPMLHEIRQRPDAPGVTLLLGLEDHIFRVEEYLESLTASTDIDQIVIAPGPHSISGRPEILQLALDQLQVTKDMRARGVDISTIPLRDRIHFPPNIDPKRREKILQLASELDARTAKLLAKRAATKTS